LTGTVGDGSEVLRGRAEMEVKVDGDGWGWKQSLRGRVGMGVMSVPVQVSTCYRLLSVSLYVCSHQLQLLKRLAM